MKRFAVIGLGTFGMGLARALAELGAQVTAVDRDAAHVDAVKDEVHAALKMDARDRDALAEQRIHDLDCVVICMGEDFEAAEICAVHLTDLGCRRLIVRGTSRERVEILSQLVPEVIVPGLATARQLALQLLAPAIRDCAVLVGSQHFAIIETPPGAAGQPLAALKLDSKSGARILAVRRGVTPDSELVIGPPPEFLLHEKDCVLLFGPEEDILKAAERLASRHA